MRFFLADMYAVEVSPDILGLRIEQTEGAKFWIKVFTELKPAGVRTSSLRSPMD